MPGAALAAPEGVDVDRTHSERPIHRAHTQTEDSRMSKPVSGRRQSKSRRNKPARQLGLEALEDRNMLSASPTSPAIDLSGLSVNSSQYSSSDILVQFKSGAVVNSHVPTLPGTTAGSQLGLVSGLYEINLNPGMTVSRRWQNTAPIRSFKSPTPTTLSRPALHRTTRSSTSSGRCSTPARTAELRATTSASPTPGALPRGVRARSSP